MTVPACAAAWAAGALSLVGGAFAGDPCIPEYILNPGPLHLNSWGRAVLSSGEGLYYGGHFTVGDDAVPLGYIARREGGAWNPLGGGMNSWVNVLAEVEGHGAGGGRVLYAGGLFTEAGGVEANFIAGWDEAMGAWSALGTGLNGHSDCLSAFAPAEGGPSLLLVSGSFTHAGGIESRGLAAWDGTQWMNIGDVEGGSIYAMTTFDDGDGPALYAGGSFQKIGGVEAGGLARWSGPGGEWEAVAGVNGTVRALRSFDDGSGRALYVAGKFSIIGGVAALNIARFDPAGVGWSAMGEGLPGVVHALAVYGDGSFANDAPVLWAGGTYPPGPDEPSWTSNDGIARWDGASWDRFDWPFTLFGYGVRSLAVHVEDGAAVLQSAGPQQMSSAWAFHWAWQGCPSLNSTCDAARPVGAGATAMHNFNAPTDGPADCDALDEDWSDVWFTYEVECDADVRIGVCADGFPVRVAVYDACPESPGEALACSGGSCAPGEAAIELPGSTGQSLLIRVGGASGAQGAAVLRIQCGQRAGDLNGDDNVDVADLLIMLEAWGPCPGKGACPADLNDDGTVDVLDLLVLLANWG